MWAQRLSFFIVFIFVFSINADIYNNSLRLLTNNINVQKKPLKKLIKTNKKKLNKIKKNQYVQKEKSKNFIGEFQFSETQFINSDKAYFQSTQTPVSERVISMKVDGSWGEGHRVKLKARDHYYLNRSKNRLNISDFYYEVGKNNPLFLSIGRKKENWTYSEEFWATGLWQPRNQFEPLNLKNEGLTGIFLQTQNKIFGGLLKAQIFYSEIFIPEETRDFEIINGKFYTKDPWFFKPIQKVTVKDVERDLYFALNKPAVSDIVHRKSNVLQIKYEHSGLEWGTTYADKPMNTFFYNLDYFERVEEPVINININPTIQNHILNSYFIGYKKNKFKMTLDYVKESPQLEKAIDTQISQRASESHHMSTSLQYMNSRKTLFYISATSVRGGFAPDSGENANSSESVFEPRFRFYEALKLGFKNLKPWTEKLNLSLEMIYDKAQRAGVFRTQWDYIIHSNFKWGLEMAFLGLVDEDPVIINEGFLRKFRANDYLQLGLKYVF